MRRAAPLVPVLLLIPALAKAQLAVALLDTVPPGLVATAQGQVTLRFAVTGTADPVRVDFFRDDGAAPVTVDLPDPTAPPPPFEVTLPLKTDVDRVANRFTAVARDQLSNQVALSGPLEVLSDDVGPDPPELTSPAFPATAFGEVLRLDGRVSNAAPGTPATLPETGGQVVVRRAPGGAVLGGAAIRPDSSFAALVDLSGLAPGVASDLEVLAIDPMGNAGAAVTVAVTRLQAAAPTVTATLEPPDGTLTPDPGVAVSGRVSGDGPAITLHVFVDGRLSSQLVGLASGSGFRHTLTLPGPGEHAVAVQASYAGQPPEPRLATPLGSVTLDRGR